MKVITHKQMKLATEHPAQPQPGVFPSYLPALEILGLLGFGDEVVQAETSG